MAPLHPLIEQNIIHYPHKHEYIPIISSDITSDNSSVIRREISIKEKIAIRQERRQIQQRATG